MVLKFELSTCFFWNFTVQHYSESHALIESDGRTADHSGTHVSAVQT